MDNTSSTPTPSSDVRPVRRNDGTTLYKLGSLNTFANVNVFMGSLKVHVRRYVPPTESRFKDYTPTEKGVALSVAELTDLVKALPTISKRLLSLNPRKDLIDDIKAIGRVSLKAPPVDIGCGADVDEDEAPLEVAYMSEAGTGMYTELPDLSTPLSPSTPTTSKPGCSQVPSVAPPSRNMTGARSGGANQIQPAEPSTPQQKGDVRGDLQHLAQCHAPVKKRKL